ncbi:MAG: NAD-dependent deacylase [Alistipes sp.]|nr:NAD-dependent deacylase [Alistipes sp.]
MKQLMKKKIVVFTGAGMSADSGLATFRDADGLWAEYRIEDVCTPEALRRDRATVIGFYNMRRREMLGREPNAGHLAVAALERHFEVEVVTQNVDNLHERAGSSRVIHLHGELTKLRSSADPGLVVPIEGWEQPLDATAPDGALLRPHIVFFGESVPMFDRAVGIVSAADLFVVVGTSLAVYPAASLVRYVRPGVPVFLVDPGEPDTSMIRNPFTHVRARAAEGMPALAERLEEEFR